MRLDPTTGLTAAEVAERVARGQVNATSQASSRSLWVIFKTNVFTRFNAILGALFVLILSTGSLADGLFGVVLVVNSAIGIVQEYLAKRKLDRLALLNSPTTRVLRDGTLIEMPTADVVLDDLIELRTGDQVPADGRMLSHLRPGDRRVEPDRRGGCDPEVRRRRGALRHHGGRRHRPVPARPPSGPDAYINKIAAEAKKFTKTRSEIQESVNQLLKYITWIIIVALPLQLWSQWRAIGDQGWQQVVIRSTGGLVGLVPEGLVLLTSVAFLLAAVQLTRQQVLVQELPAVEGLARVNIVCLDKTGTLTVGDIAYEDCEPLRGPDAGRDPGGARRTGRRPERQRHPEGAGGGACRRPTAGSRAGHHRVQLGAQVERRVLHRPRVAGCSARPTCCSTADDPLRRPGERTGRDRPAGAAAGPLRRAAGRARSCPAGISRGGAGHADRAGPAGRRRTPCDYFKDQGVRVKIISGDNPTTVGAIARRVGLDVGPDAVVDARTIGDDPEELREIAEKTTVFGRVSPEQKRALVQALQRNGHVVAMTGDGVNDALALKDADIGVAMGNGAQATKAVAQLVLLDGKFSHMPSVLAEGRRVIGNVERVANLFVAKNVMSLVAILSAALFVLPFPFLPRHLTLVSAVTIGIPAFFLALGPEQAPLHPRLPATGCCGSRCRPASCPGSWCWSRTCWPAMPSARRRRRNVW